MRAGGIAVLGALATLAAEHGAQAHDLTPIDWIVPGVSTARLSKLAGSEEDPREGYVESRKRGENSAGKISSASGSGGRGCEMSREEFAKSYPPLLDWIRTTLMGSAAVAQTVASRGFSRLRFTSVKRLRHRPRLS